MATDPVPFFVGQAGVRHSAETVRLGLYASTGGAEGVAGVSDLKVQAQAVPNGTVRVLTGGALLLNRYAGGSNQSYALRNATATDVTVTPTGSGGGRTDLVVARILDTQYEGTPPADVNAFEYSRIVTIQGVPAGTTTAKELNLGYPAIALAKITLPASTGTVTAAMITDLRRVAIPRRDRAMSTVFPTGKWQLGTGQQIPAGAYGTWPLKDAQRMSVYVPEWATRVDILVHLSGVVYAKSNDSNQTAAAVRTTFGTTTPGESGILAQDGDDAGSRMHYTVIGTHLIPSAMRGTTQLLGVQGNKTVGTGRWYGDDQTSVVLDWEFSEGAQ